MLLLVWVNTYYEIDDLEFEAKRHKSKGSNAAFVPFVYKDIPDYCLFAEGTSVLNPIKIIEPQKGLFF